MQNKLERAKQFMPFAALRGYYDLILQCEKIKEPRKVLLDDEEKIISSNLNKIKKGMLISVKYYNIDAYETITGMVSNIDKTYRNLYIIKTKIPFDDILSITFCNENNLD
jgi:hypothetical protein